MEKWLKSSRGPRNSYPRMNRKLHYAYHGKPIQLFKDSDRDGVPNVFDCKPFNKKRQDVPIPPVSGSVLGDLYARKENARLQRVYMEEQRRIAAELKALEEARLGELRRIAGETRTEIVNVASPYILTAEGKWVPIGSTQGRKAAEEFLKGSKQPTAPTGLTIQKPTTTTVTLKIPEDKKAKTGAQKSTIIGIGKGK